MDVAQTAALRLRRQWRKTTVTLNAGWRFGDHRSTGVHEVDHRQSEQTGAEQRDLEANSVPALPTTASALAHLPSTRSGIAKQIKRIPQLVRAVGSHSSDTYTHSLNNPHQCFRRQWRKAAVALNAGWSKATVVLNAGWRFSDRHSTGVLEVDHRQSEQTGAEQRDLEANSVPALPTTASALAHLPSTRSGIAKQIKRIPQLVRAVGSHSSDTYTHSLNNPHQCFRRQWRKAAVALNAGWSKATVVLNAGWRFSDRHSTGVLEVDHRQSEQTGAEQRDLEANSVPALPTMDRPLACLPSTRSGIAKQIKRIPQLVRAFFNDAPRDDEHKQLQKRCSKYSQKALLFAITTLVAYLGSSSASSSTGNTAFKVAMAAFFVAIPVDLISATRTPKWGCALVYLSLFLLVLQSYLLLVSIHKDYICAMVPVLLFAALLPWKQPSVRQQDSTEGEPPQSLDSNEADQDQDKADQDLENIFDWSAGIVNCGGLISMVLGHYLYMVGPNRLPSASIIGYLFFFTVVTGLYLMMVTTVRTAALTPNVSFFTYLRDFLLVGTLIATLIHGVRLSWNDSHV